MKFIKDRVNSFFRRGGDLLTKPQEDILSAATIIMVMIAASRVLGLVRNRTLAHFFTTNELSIYFAAFRLPEVVFEVLVFGTLSAAFVPTFTKYLSEKKLAEGWHVASASLTAALMIFLSFSLIIFVFPKQLYQMIAPGYTQQAVIQIAKITRILVFTQIFFVISYFLTAILESLKRFLIPAIAPLFYNLGIIAGAIIFGHRFGLYGPVIGAVCGAFLHFLIQLPLAIHFGFRPRLEFDIRHPGVRQIGKLALPRMIELSFLEIWKVAELFFASLVTISAYTYYTFANSLQLLPVGLFGSSIAKASLPSLSYRAAADEKEKFNEVLVGCFGEINFLVVPCAVFLAILRIPAVRLVFGARQFTWEATVQTGQALSAFALGIFPQSSNYLFARAFYALHDTKTPVKVSVVNIILGIALGGTLVYFLKLPVWGLALAFSIAAIIQFLLLLIFLSKKIGAQVIKRMVFSLLKICVAAGGSGMTMFLLLKILDQSVWAKRLSFLSRLGLILPTNFERFVFDTRYVSNVIGLTAIVAFFGFLTYLFLSSLLKIKESAILLRFVAKFKGLRPSKLGFPKKQEPITFDNS